MSPHQKKILKNKKRMICQGFPLHLSPKLLMFVVLPARIQRIIRHILVLISHSLLSLNPFWSFKKVVTLNLKIAVTNNLQISHYVLTSFIVSKLKSLTGYCLYTNDLINQHS